MSREDLKDIIGRIIRKLEQERDESAPPVACIFGDNCDVTTKYAINEEN
jgi:hypothetical protein